MQTSNVLAVASSVSSDRFFDAIDAINYAADNKFRGIQIYLNQEMVDNAELREKTRSICREKNLTLIAHAPSTLCEENILNDSLNRAIHHLLMFEDKVRVVHHFDETVKKEKALEYLNYLHDQKFTICLENFFLLGSQTSEKCFRDYLQILREAKLSGIDIIPVLDIPRLYDPKVNLAHIASNLLEEAFEVFKTIGTSIILHLIDVAKNSVSQAREMWCPVGEGMIPYPEIFRQLVQHEINVYMVVLEFEDKINPIKSKKFLSEYFY